MSENFPFGHDPAMQDSEMQKDPMKHEEPKSSLIADARSGYGGGGGERGRVFEVRFFGKVNWPKELFEEYKKTVQQDRRGFTKRPEQIYPLIKKYFPKDPTKPDGLSYDLRDEIMDAMELSRDEIKNLKIYSTLNSPLDPHGVDGLVEYVNPDTGKSHFVSLDTSLDPAKADQNYILNADVLIENLPDASQEPDAYGEVMEKYGKDIAERLQNQMR